MSQPPGAAVPVPVEALRDDIRARRHKLATNPGEATPWPSEEEATSAELFYYDMALVVAANVLGLPVPPPARGGRRRMTARQRNHLEERLAASGCDVRGAPSASAGPAPDEAAMPIDPNLAPPWF